MAQRDVQLIIRAKDEASRALNRVGELIGQLDIRQKGATASGNSFAASLVETVHNMARLEQATGLVVAASNRAEQAIDRQRAAVAATGAEIASVAQQLAAAQRAINAAQVRVVNARLSGGDGTAEVARLVAAQAAVRDLEAQQTRLTNTLKQQETTLRAQANGFQQLASSANTAEAALASFGDDAARN